MIVRVCAVDLHVYLIGHFELWLILGNSEIQIKNVLICTGHTDLYSIYFVNQLEVLYVL